jgi:acetoin utilization deacetylase AcuC-like enzyme
MRRAPLRTVRVFYSLDVVADSGRRASPSDRKPRLVSEALLATGWPVEIVAPEPADVEDIFRVHDPSFVSGVLKLERSNGFGSVSSSVARSLPYTSGACLGAAMVALHDGISASLTSGFHHAGPHGPRGFCTFNGLMIAAVKLLSLDRVARVAIVDCDYHYGDGTQAIIDAQGLGERVLHLSFGKHYRAPHQAAQYLEEVDRLGSRFAEFRPELVLYQAGADTHVDDPLGGLLTTEQMRVRDRAVFAIARELGIPLTWNLAGGYQIEADGSIPRVVELHLNTFREALTVWGLL